MNNGILCCLCKHWQAVRFNGWQWEDGHAMCALKNEQTARGYRCTDGIYHTVESISKVNTAYNELAQCNKEAIAIGIRTSLEDAMEQWYQENQILFEPQETHASEGIVYTKQQGDIDIDWSTVSDEDKKVAEICLGPSRNGDRFFRHQQEDFWRFKDSTEIDLFNEQGTGKTATILRIAAWKYLHDQIDSLLYVGPNNVHRQTALQQIPLWLPEAVPRELQLFGGAGGAHDTYPFRYPDYLHIVCVNIDTFSTPKKWMDIAAWVKQTKCMIILDEATCIKNLKSKRTERMLYEFNDVVKRKKQVVSSVPQTVARANLTGTPTTNSHCDLWCVAGYTEVLIKYGHNESIQKVEIRKLYKKFNHIPYQGSRPWDNDRQILIKSLLPDGSMGYCKLQAVTYTGWKECWAVRLDNGSRLVCTSDHKLLTTRGYLPLEEIQLGDSIMVSDNNYYTGQKQTEAVKKYIKNRNKNRIRVDGKIMYRARAVMQAYLGRELTPYEHVHHKDGDQNNNYIENLELLTASEHAALHNKDTAKYYTDDIHVLLRPKPCVVVKIEKNIGVQDVYDITCEAHNFVANKLIVHNCLQEFLRPNYFGRNWYSFRARYAMLATITTPYGTTQVMINEKMWEGIKACKEYTEAFALFGVSQDTYNTVQMQSKYQGAYKHEEELRELIAPVASFRLLKDCIDMPEQVYNKKTVAMSAEQQRAYNDMEQQLIAQYSGATTTAANKLSALVRLQQISSGFIVQGMFEYNAEDPETWWGEKVDIEPGQVVWLGKTIPKLERLYEDIAESGRPIIIITRFSAEAARIYEDLKEEYSCLLYTGWKKTGNLDDFQEGKYEVLVANIRCISRGFNLQNACKMFFYSNTFSLEDRLQTEGRIFRIGQKHPCVYTDYICEGTIDLKTVGALRQKRALLDYIRGTSLKAFIEEEDEVVELEEAA